MQHEIPLVRGARLDCDSGRGRFAASLDRLVVAGGTKLDRYSLETVEKEGGVTLPAGQASPVLLMGSATRGPLVSLVDGVPGLLDQNTLEATKAAGIDIPKRDKWNDKATRISAAGRTIFRRRSSSWRYPRRWTS